MNGELALLILKKLNIPHATKAGLILSLIVFETFDIKERAKRAMASKMSA